MAATNDLDPVFRYALKLLHSPSTDSAEKIRNALDDIIKQRHGSNKMLANTLNNKYLAEESLAPGSGAANRRHSHRSSDQASSASSKSNSSPSHVTITTTEAIGISPLVISVTDDDDDDELTMEEDQLKELEDLMCVVCRRMDVSARNRLIECADCHSLFHQDCHKPAISDSDANEQEFSWCCALCKNKIKSASVASPAKSSSSHSSSSSSSSGYHHTSVNPKVVSTFDQSSVTVTSHSISTSSSSTHKSSSSSKVSSSGTSKVSSSSSSSGSKSSSSGSSHSNSVSGDSGRGNSSNGSNSTLSLSGSSSGVGGSSSSNNSSSSKSNVTPTINIISADKRLQNMKKKAAKLQETRRKHKH